VYIPAWYHIYAFLGFLAVGHQLLVHNDQGDASPHSPPYLDLALVLPATPLKSSAPRMTLYCCLHQRRLQTHVGPELDPREKNRRAEPTLTPGRSFVRPPRTSTTLCSCRLWPSPGIYAIVDLPVVSFTLQTFRTAELGFFGLVV
jgi:hypothetical protein